MAQEIEIKLKIGDVTAFRRTLKKIGARSIGNGTRRVHESNLLFDTPEGVLGKSGQLLRIRTETRDTGARDSRHGRVQRFLLTFKCPPKGANGVRSQATLHERHKVREESELEIADAAILTKIFEGLGMNGWFRYEKYRTTFRLPESATWAKGLLIELDETPIGAFAELEGPPQAIDRAARALGFSTDDYVLQNYLSLYMEDCRRRGQKPGNMLFAPTK